MPPKTEEIMQRICLRRVEGCGVCSSSSQTYMLILKPSSNLALHLSIGITVHIIAPSPVFFTRIVFFFKQPYPSPYRSLSPGIAPSRRQWRQRMLSSRCRLPLHDHLKPLPAALHCQRVSMCLPSSTFNSFSSC